MILVTGGAGFIGAALVRALVEAGESVRVLDSGYRGQWQRLAGLNVEQRLCDIRDRASVLEACTGIDEVIHLAGINGTPTFYKDPGLVLNVGVRGMLSVLDACGKTGVRKLVLASSSEVNRAKVESSGEQEPMVIPDPYNPRYSYSAAKIISEMLSIHSDAVEDLRIIRPYNVYGPGMAAGHVVPDFIAQMRVQHAAFPDGLVPFQILGDGSETRSFCYIDDFVRGVMLIRSAGSVGTYNVGTDEETSIASLAVRIGSVLGRTLNITQLGELREGEIKRRRPDISKLRALGYRPQVTLGDGLRRVVNQ